MAEITIILAFLAGLVSFLSPCVLPLIPAYMTYLAGTSLKDIEANIPGARRSTFISSVFYVLGFSVVFSILGVLLQSVLVEYAFDLRTYLGYIGGTVIIFFGLFMVGLIKIPWLSSDHKISVKQTKNKYLTSFLFGSAFAVGWTPCVGAVLGGVLTLAVTEPGLAFPLMLAYSLGLGIPFLLVGAFFSRAQNAIKIIAPHLETLNKIFGIILIILGILVFTNTLTIVANIFVPYDLFLG